MLTLLCLFIGIIGFSLPSNSQSQQISKEQSQLSKLKKTINNEKNKISQATKQRALLEQLLKKNDIAISTIAKNLNHTKNNLITIQADLAALSNKKQKLTHQKQQQENLLAKQLRTAYSSGDHDYLKLLLNQEDPSTIQRSLTYYQYLNKARIKEIETFKITISHLLEVVSQHQEQSVKLQKIQQTQQAQQNELLISKKQRSQTIKAFNKQIQNSQQQLAKLASEEENLLIEIERLMKQAKRSRRLTGLSKLKGKLKWPINAKIRHRFGTRKQGYLKWKGVLMSTPAGQQVKSIHNGKVLFSDWLKGYGLVTVLDHGNGYMSLYGHNQALLKSVGDSVEIGETIALSGQSGGQSQSGLYFEIRYNGQAVNPKTWCR